MGNAAAKLKKKRMTKFEVRGFKPSAGPRNGKPGEGGIGESGETETQAKEADRSTDESNSGSKGKKLSLASRALSRPDGT